MLREAAHAPAPQLYCSRGTLHKVPPCYPGLIMFCLAAHTSGNAQPEKHCGASVLLWMSLFIGLTASMLLPIQSGVRAQPVPAGNGAAFPLTQYVHDSWQVEDGLPQNSVNAVVRTQDGYLWLGTQAGLARFDGVKFTAYTSTNTPELKSDFITALIEDRSGRLWIGTALGGILRIDGNKFESITAADGLPSENIETLLEDQDGSIWIGTLGDGLIHFDGERYRSFTESDGLPGSNVLALEQDAGGTLWIGTDMGIARYQRGKFHSYSEADGLTGSVVKAILSDPRGNLWVGMLDGTVCRKEAGTFRCDILSGSAAEAGILTLHEDRDGALWIGTTAGVYRVVNGQVQPFTSEQGLTHDIVRSVVSDEEGNIWIATEAGGLNRLRLGSFSTIGAADGLQNEVVLSVAQDASGTIYVGTDGAGLYELQGLMARPVAWNNRLPSAYVYALNAAADGSLWIGTYGGGACQYVGGKLNCFSEKDGLTDKNVFAVFVDRSGTTWIGTQSGLYVRKGDGIELYRGDDALATDQITSIVEGAAGKIWVGTYSNGVRAIEGGRVEAFTTANGLSSDAALALMTKRDGSVWVGTHGGGMCRIQKQASVICYTTKEGLSDNDVLQILDDGAGSLWLGSLKNISRVSLQELEEQAAGKIRAVSPTIFGREDGLKSTEVNGGAQSPTLKSADGRLFFATMQGLAVTDPQRSSGQAAPPPVLLQRLRVNDQPVPLEAHLTLPPGSRNLSFDFTAPTFIKSEGVTFYYMLEGYDRHWIDAGTRRSAFYTNLPPHSYRFVVRSRNADGTWSTAPAEVTLTLRPYFYQSVWFLALCAVLMLLLTVALYRMRIRALQQRERLLQRKVDDQTRELLDREAELQLLNSTLEEEVQRQLGLMLAERRRYESELVQARDKAEASSRLKSMILDNMSHEFRTPISAIMGSAQILGMEVNQDQQEFVGYIEENGKRLLETLNGILDLSRLESDAFETDWETIDVRKVVREVETLYAAPAARKGLLLEVDVPSSPLLAHCDSDVLQRILGNLTSNAVKFTDTGRITLSAFSRSDGVVLRVQDTGVGIGEAFMPHMFEAFQQESDGLSRSHEGTGLGLAITQRLVARIGGRIEVQSKQGEGTTVTVSVPVRQSANDDRPSPRVRTLAAGTEAL